MESSDSDDEEDRVSVRPGGQADRLAREDDDYRFTSDLSEEDSTLMRDNNLLSPRGESTKEELQKRLRIMKENLRQNSDENTDRDASDNESSEDSLLDWLTTVGQTENVTSEQKENQSWREESQMSANSGELRFGLEINLDLDDETSNPENEYVASAQLPRREDTEDSQRQVENPQSESLFTTASASEHDPMETLMEVPPTRNQRRPRSRSPDSRRTRARTDSWIPRRTLWELFRRLNEGTPSQTFKQPLISENDTFSRTGHEETLRQQMPGHELQNRSLSETSRTRNAVDRECYSDTTGSSQSWEVRETNPIRLFSLSPINCLACCHRYREVSRTQLTSNLPNNTTTSASEQEELEPMSSDSDEADESAYANTIRNPLHRILNPSLILNTTSLNTSLSGTMPITTQTILCQTMTVFSDSGNLMHSDSISEHSVSRPSENMGRAESPNERHGPYGRDNRPGSASNASYNSDSNLILISVSNPYDIHSATLSQMSGFNSRDEDSAVRSPIFEDSEERSSSTGLSETRQEGGLIIPIIDDDSDSGSSLNLDHFLLNEAGLTQLQIDNLPVRFSEEEDAAKICTICITEYTAGNMLRILPCSHEYHYQCIDQWLTENSTCPVCRRPVVNNSEPDDFM